MPLIGGQLAADVCPINLGLALHILLAAAAVDGGHVLHPEVISVSPHGVDGLLEADFDFEPPAIKANNLQRVQGQIGAQEDQGPASRVAHPDKAHQLAQRTPQQVVSVIVEGNARFPIDRAEGLDELLPVPKPVPEVGFGTIDSGSPPPPA